MADTVVVIQPEITQVTAAQPGLPGPPGAPGAPGGAAYLHTQSTAAATWTINHNLGFRPDVAVRDSGGNEVLAQVLHVSANQTVIYFATPTAGEARFI